MMDSITNAADTVVTFMGKVFEVMTGNAYFATLLAVSLLVVGVGVFRMIRRASR